MRKEYTLFKRKRKIGTVWYFYYRENNKRKAQSTGKKTKWEAEIYVKEYFNHAKKSANLLTIKEYASQYYV